MRPSQTATAAFLLLVSFASAANLPLTDALKQQISAEATHFTGRGCLDGYVAKHKAIPDAQLAKMMVSSGQNVVHQPGFTIKKEQLSNGGLTYQFFGVGAGRNMFMKTAYVQGDGQPGILYHICNLK